MKTAIGIDLGTTFSAVAAIRGNEPPVVLKNADGESATPSVIYFPEQGAPVVGNDAKEIQMTGDPNIAAFFKRNIGDPEFFMEFHGKRYSAIDLSSIMLCKLKNDAESALGESISDAVITVPAYFNNFEREATIKAAEKAGLHASRIINEPTAAAIAYGFGNNGPTEKLVMIYDLGGGTFDVSLIRSSRDAIQVLGTDGDHRLGGKDWDDRIAKFLAARFFEEYAQNPFDDQDSFNDLLIRCEKAKKELSKKEKTTIRITHGGETGSYVLSRMEFETLTSDLLQRTKELSEAVLREHKPPFEWSDLDGVLLVGGSSRMPMVETFVTAMTGKQPLRGINVDEAVALGAAIQAASDQAKNDFELEASSDFSLPGMRSIDDVIGHSLGMVVENEDRSRYVNSIIISKNSRIPCTSNKAHTLRVSSSQNELEVYMLQGESECPSECTILGKYVFSGISPTSVGRAVIDVSYSYNENGIVGVSAVQRDTGKPLALRIEALPEDMSWLNKSPAEVNKIELPEIAVVFIVDTSGSMFETPILQAQEAMRCFMKQINTNNFSIGIGAFGDSTKIILNLTKNRGKIDKAISQLSANPLGGTNGVPFYMAKTIMASHRGPKYIVLLTDGEWFRPEQAIKEAQRCAREGIEIIAVGIGDADLSFLQKLATCSDNALFTDLSNLSLSFSKIAQVLSDSTELSSPQEAKMTEESDSQRPSSKHIFSTFFE